MGFTIQPKEVNTWTFSSSILSHCMSMSEALRKGEGKGLVTAATLQLFLLNSAHPGRHKLGFHNARCLFVSQRLKAHFNRHLLSKVAHEKETMTFFFPPGDILT